jgi:hypothetical protein
MPPDRIMFRIVPEIGESWGLSVGVEQKSMYNHIIQPIDRKPSG